MQNKLNKELFELREALIVSKHIDPKVLEKIESIMELVNESIILNRSILEKDIESSVKFQQGYPLLKWMNQYEASARLYLRVEYKVDEALVKDDNAKQHITEHLVATLIHQLEEKYGSSTLEK